MNRAKPKLRKLARDLVVRERSGNKSPEVEAPATFHSARSSFIPGSDEYLKVRIVWLAELLGLFVAIISLNQRHARGRDLAAVDKEAEGERAR